MFGIEPDDVPERRPRRVLPTLIGIAVAVAVLLVAAAGTGAYLHTPTRLTLQALASGVPPWAVQTSVSERHDHPYSQSSFVLYLDQESAFVDFDRARVEGFADDVAEGVAFRLAAETGLGDPHEAERALWRDGKGGKIPVWIAEELRSRGVYYHSESLLSRSFDPALRRDGGIHMDCDQLVHVFEHVAWRLDLDMAVVPAPMHAYIVYREPNGGEGAFWLEATEFRTIEQRGNTIDLRGKDLGDSFFIDEDHHRSGKGGTRADPEYAAAVGYYEPMDERDLQDAIVANVLVGVKKADPEVDVLPLLRARLEGTRNGLLVSNLWTDLCEHAEEALARGDADAARTFADEAVALRQSHGHLIVWSDLKGRLLAARAAEALGDEEARAAHLEAVLAAYASQWRDRRVARGPVHARALLMAAQRMPPVSVSTTTTCCRWRTSRTRRGSGTFGTTCARWRPSRWARTSSPRTWGARSDLQAGFRRVQGRPRTGEDRAGTPWADSQHERPPATARHSPS